MGVASQPDKLANLTEVPLSSGTDGALSEQGRALYLIRQGSQVLPRNGRSLHPKQCPDEGGKSLFLQDPKVEGAKVEQQALSWEWEGAGQAILVGGLD